MDIVTRQKAKDESLVRFFTGEPCKNGHISERNTKSSTCVVCDREKKRLIRKDPKKIEVIKAQSRKSREKHKAQRAIDNKIWREKNKDEISAKKKEYRENNKEKVTKTKKEWVDKNAKHVASVKRDWLKNNKAKALEAVRRWRDKNREQVRAKNTARLKKLKDRGSYSGDDVKLKLELQKNKCLGCFSAIDGLNYHIDHITPIAKGGMNTPDNIQILCPHCNLSKGAKYQEEFYQDKGFLL